MSNILVTGGAGFIGSNFVDAALNAGHRVTVLDALTYAGNLANLSQAKLSSKFTFVKGNICNEELIYRSLTEHDIQFVINFAAESHVDRSIDGPSAFIATNLVGTYSLLNSSKEYWNSLNDKRKSIFRFIQISTDEVFGELGDVGKFNEETPYSPNSPYSASKAGADHLARAWYHTYKLPVIITNCSNNYGPRQYPEKLIPLIINSALKEQPLPVYGKGENVRDWIHVKDHCRGILRVVEKGAPGESYCFGGNSERKNLDVVKQICKILDRRIPRSKGMNYEKLITFVTDRAGHDWRYAIDDTKATKNLGFSREFENFESGLESTIDWYCNNKEWCESISGELGI